MTRNEAWVRLGGVPSVGATVYCSRNGLWAGVAFVYPSGTVELLSTIGRARRCWTVEWPSMLEQGWRLVPEVEVRTLAPEFRPYPPVAIVRCSPCDCAVDTASTRVEACNASGTAASSRANEAGTC